MHSAHLQTESIATGRAAQNGSVRRHVWTVQILGLTLLIVTGCEMLWPTQAAPAGCEFPEGTEIAWVGVATLRQLGLAGELDPSFADARGQVFVTAEPIVMEMDLVPRRRACIRFEEPVGEIPLAVAAIPEGWVLPD